MKSNTKTLVFQNNKMLNIDSLSNILPLIFTRKLLLIILFLSFFTSMQAQQKYTVKGKIEGLTKEIKVFLEYNFNDKSVKDSVITKNGTFNFNGTISRPVMASLILLPMEKATPLSGNKFQSESRKFYLSSGITSVSGNSLKSAVIKGVKAQNEYMELSLKLNPIQDSVSKYAWATDATKKAKLQMFRLKMAEIVRTFIAANKNSFVSLDLVGEKTIALTDTKDIENLYSMLNADLKKTTEGKRYGELISIAKRTAIGMPAIDFTQNDPDGNPISLASFKGKYVLIDFWASWCVWCRIEYPYLKKAYSQFKDKNFEIISVSLDDKKSNWVKAIKDNEFTWPQVCDLKGRKNEVVWAYGIKGIPQCFLIDPKGIIIARNLRGDKLIEKLNEVIKTQK